MFLRLIIRGEKSQTFKLNSRTLLSSGLMIFMCEGTSTCIIFHRVIELLRLEKISEIEANN